MSTSHYEYEGVRGTMHVFVSHPRMDIYYRDDLFGGWPGYLPLRGERWSGVGYSFTSKGALKVEPPYNCNRRPGADWTWVLTEEEARELVEEARVIVPEAFIDFAQKMQKTVDGAYRSMEKSKEIYQNYLVGLEELRV